LKKTKSISSHSKVLTGELEYAKLIKILYFLDDVPSQADLSASKQELELREQVAKEEKNSLSAKSKRSKKSILSLKNKIYNVNKINCSKLFAKKIYKKTQLWANNPIATQKFYKINQRGKANAIWNRPSF
jgi:hypothetical protein